LNNRLKPNRRLKLFKEKQMGTSVLGLHHITAIAGNAKQNLDFYTRVLGLRLVKKTVNFDDPGTFHFYFGDKVGTPGTILTFFPWEGMTKGYPGSGMATEIGYSVPQGSLEFWQRRIGEYSTPGGEFLQRFSEKHFVLKDPDGLNIHLIEPGGGDTREPWVTPSVDAAVATRGFHSVTLTVRRLTPTAKILTDILGYELIGQEGNIFRFVSPFVENAAIVDVIEAKDVSRGLNATGTNHHVAFRVRDEDALMYFRQKIEKLGLSVTPKIDRDYFFSVYFREPGGVLFELATENPGFTRDETQEQLGTHLKLPAKYESMRSEIEKVLPRID
jgi:glyoxalase family protein